MFYRFVLGAAAVGLMNGRRVLGPVLALFASLRVIAWIASHPLLVSLFFVYVFVYSVYFHGWSAIDALPGFVLIPAAMFAFVFTIVLLVSGCMPQAGLCLLVFCVIVSAVFDHGFDRFSTIVSPSTVTQQHKLADEKKQEKQEKREKLEREKLAECRAVGSYADWLCRSSSHVSEAEMEKAEAAASVTGR